MKFSSPHSLSPYASVGELNLDEGEKKKNKTMQVKAETGKGKKKKKRNNRLAFILRRQWVGKWIPAKLRAGLSH